MAVKASLAAFGFLLEVLLAFGCLAFAVTRHRELCFERPPLLTEALKAPQLGELAGELLTLPSGVAGLGGGVLGVSERPLSSGSSGRLAISRAV